ncbi:hypothetical protein K435DRAFT_229284 [Dendrothele bispora CBS 962.96]|uniref:Uncharacterized protein n=1 Tax=Dendrothele bispora (strain CBS 962.96) TaxID=1314807 RepID=A0A4S8MM40_DENBC|nr:hypothetical protein K435DRAFT_229284 [Dendrothele bispora CBS 962.96]
MQTPERVEVDLNFNFKLDLPTPSPPPSHTSLPSESTDSIPSSTHSSITPETTPETTPDGSVTDTATIITSTDTITNSLTTATAPPIPIPPIPSNSTLALPVPGPRRHKSTGILMTSNGTRTRSSSLPGSSSSLSSDPTPYTNVNIKFAPLPELAPRRRKSNVPLGVAARGQLMRRRRAMMYGETENGSPMWTEEETEAHLKRQMEGQEKRSISLLRAMQEQEEKRGDDDAEDPFVALGRLMKGAWKKMSGKDKSKGAAVAATASGEAPMPPEGEAGKDGQEETKSDTAEPEESTNGGNKVNTSANESGTRKELSDGKQEAHPEDWQTQTTVD